MAKNDYLQIRINEVTKARLVELAKELNYDSLSEMVRDIITNKRVVEMMKDEKI